MDSRSGEETSRADYDLAASPDRHDGDGLQANLEVNLAGQSHSSCRTQPSIVSDYHLGKPLVHIHANSRVASPAHPLLVPLLCGGGSSGQNGNCGFTLAAQPVINASFRHPTDRPAHLASSGVPRPRSSYHMPEPTEPRGTSGHRDLIPVTNAVESLNRSLREIIKTFGSFATDEARRSCCFWRFGTPASIGVGRLNGSPQ